MSTSNPSTYKLQSGDQFTASFRVRNAGVSETVLSNAVQQIALNRGFAYQMSEISGSLTQDGIFQVDIVVFQSGTVTMTGLAAAVAYQLEGVLSNVVGDPHVDVIAVRGSAIQGLAPENGGPVPSATDILKDLLKKAGNEVKKAATPSFPTTLVIVIFIFAAIAVYAGAASFAGRAGA